MKLKLLVLAIAAAFSASVFAQANQGAKDKATPSQSPSAPASSAQGSSAPGSSAQGAASQGSSATGASGAQAQQRDRVRDPAQHAQGMSSDTVKQAQQALKDKGHDPGPIDGQYGPLTQKGVKEFQEKQNLKATGRLDQQTLSALGVQEGSSAVGAGADKKDTKTKPAKKDSNKDSTKKDTKDKM